MSGAKPSDACDVRFGQVGLANVRILADDPAQLRGELARRVAASPALFERTAVVMDLSHLAEQPPDEHVRKLLQAIRDAGMLPVGLAYGSRSTEELAARLDLPLIARFRKAYERDDEDDQPAPRQSAAKTSNKAPDAKLQPGLVHDAQVRSGQQVYAQGRDLIVTAGVASGAEVIADGSVHVYGALHGRALAGAQGETHARIFCTDFQAQLVSIAGRYRVFEEVPEQYQGHAVQCWLENDKLHIAIL